jgi:hypothetical protein
MLLNKLYFRLKKSFPFFLVIFSFIFLCLYLLQESKYASKQRKIRKIQINNYIKDHKHDSKSSNNNTAIRVCKIEELDPWDPKIKSYFKTTPIYNKCVQNEPLTYFDQKNYILGINQTINHTIYFDSIVKCEWASVERNLTLRESFYLTEFFEFNSTTIRIVDHEFIQTRCYQHNLKKNTTQIIYEYVHYIFINKKNFKLLKNDSDSQPKLNVMMLVLDAVSLSSMKRALPKTLEYLKSHENFFLFNKHHVTGDNTFQNLVPLLTNMNGDSLLKRKNKIVLEFKDKKKTKKVNIEPPFDEFPFIWKNFSQKGYLTYFSEEWRDSTFYNLKYGFKEQPTDFYLRQFWLALYKSRSYSPTAYNSNPRPCYYNKLLHKISFDWLKSLENFHLALEQENNIENIPRFGLVKVNEMSHDYLDRLFWIDNDVKALLSDLFTEKFLDNTLFIIMGDHGHRFHEVRKTFIGKIEEKLPMFGMMVPRKLLRKNSDIKSILTENTSSKTFFKFEIVL